MMKMHGSLVSNLEGAVESARRLRDQPVHWDTQQYWANLAVHARGALDSKDDADIIAVRRLTDVLEAECARRDEPVGRGPRTAHRSGPLS
jgi:hypothetical protein